MKTINIKDHYEHIETDVMVDVTCEIYDVFEDFRKEEAAYKSKVYYHRAFYSLDRGDGIENEILFRTLLPDEIATDKQKKRKLYSAFMALTDKQARRIYAHYFLGMKKVDIARAEGSSPGSVKDSIYRGMKKIKKHMKNNP